jgi:hypothetical protein
MIEAKGNTQSTKIITQGSTKRIVHERHEKHEKHEKSGNTIFFAVFFVSFVFFVDKSPLAFWDIAHEYRTTGFLYSGYFINGCIGGAYFVSYVRSGEIAAADFCVCDAGLFINVDHSIGGVQPE